MQFTLEEINPKEYPGNLVLLYGDEVADRNLPLGKKEIERLKERRAQDPHAVLVFDRLPYRLYVVNWGADGPSGQSQEQLRRSAGKVVALLKEEWQTHVAVTGQGAIPEDLVAFLEGMALADYTFDRYKSRPQPHVERVSVSAAFLSPQELEPGCRLWERIRWCRDQVNLPVADLGAQQFADELRHMAGPLGVACTVFDKKKIQALRLGGLLAVNKGSLDEPRFVVLEYAPPEPVNPRPVALVGKGIMYDTGGLNIKPDDHMREMKSDMAGAATMAAVLFAAAENRLPVHLVALLPMTDNRPGFNAYAADDILTMYDGTTVEVVNTDAEGRIVLADAIAYAVKNHHPELIIDAATLTGAAVRAIGTYGIAAMQQNAENQLGLLKIMGNQVYERIAELPFWPEYDELIKSDVADIKNCGIAEAGAITAGRFLAHFAKQTPYIHLDIAGVAYFSKKQDYYAVGASGYGIRLLYAFLQTYYMTHSSKN